MGPLFAVIISAVLGAALFAIVALANTLLALLMGALLGASVAIMIVAFPQDLDYRERRVR